MSLISTRNCGCVIVAHSGFQRIHVSEQTQKDLFHEQLHELELAIREQRGHGNARIVKDLERAKKRLEVRLKSLAADHKKDNTLTFEELGVDRIFVDESHAFKNLFYVSKMTLVAGLPQIASERSFDMLRKALHVQQRNG